MDDNHCLNGKIRNNLSLKENLIEFARGPCNPIVLIPGLLSTKLMVKIDCQKLQQFNSEIFN